MSQETTAIVAFGLRLPQWTDMARAGEIIDSLDGLEIISAGNAFTGSLEHVVAVKATVVQTQWEGFVALDNLIPRSFKELSKAAEALGLGDVKHQWFVGISIW